MNQFCLIKDIGRKWSKSQKWFSRKENGKKINYHSAWTKQCVIIFIEYYNMLKVSHLLRKNFMSQVTQLLRLCFVMDRNTRECLLSTQVYF